MRTGGVADRELFDNELEVLVGSAFALNNIDAMNATKIYLTVN